MKKIDEKLYITLRLCFDINHQDGAWYEGEQHYLFFHSRKGEVIKGHRFFKQLRDLPIAKFIPAIAED